MDSHGDPFGPKQHSDEGLESWLVTYADGTEETCHGGDLYYWPAGHTVRVVDDAELVMFSPRAAHGHVIDHLAAKIAAQG